MTTQEPTSELVSKACSGDRQAFDTLVELYRLRLLRQIESRVGTNLRARLEPEDVFQDTLVRAYESIQRFRWQGEESFYSWPLPLLLGDLQLGERRFRSQTPDTALPCRSWGPAPSVQISSVGP